MIRVLHVLSSLDGGGVETLLRNYYSHMDREQFRFDFIVHGRRRGMLESYFRQQGGRIFHVVPKRINPVRNFLQMERIIRNGNYDVVHAHQDAVSALPLHLAAKYGVPVRIAHSHVAGTPKKKPFQQSLRRLLRISATHYLACSEPAGRWLFGTPITAGGSFQILNNAIATEQFAWQPELRQQVRAELDLDGLYVIGNVSRFTYEKNHEFLLDIYASVLQRRPDCRLLLVGEGPLKARTMQKAERMGIAGKILFLGARRDVGRLMQAMDVFVLPSRHEGFGIVLLEAQVSGLPCFTSRDAVPEAANVTGHVAYLALNQSAGIWAEQILGEPLTGRADYSPLIRKQGFEIGGAALELEDYYLKCQRHRTNPSPLRLPT